MRAALSAIDVNAAAGVGAGAGAGAGAGKGKKTVEQTYVKLTQLEHILLRPDTYGACVRDVWMYILPLCPAASRASVPPRCCTAERRDNVPVSRVL
jgi:hypothetical protein